MRSATLIGKKPAADKTTGLKIHTSHFEGEIVPCFATR
jgi:hypothetical protein